MGKRELLPHWEDVQVDLRLGWSYRSYCRFCRRLAHFSFIFDRSKCLLKCSYSSKKILFPQKRFNKLIYGINKIIKCGT